MKHWVIITGEYPPKPGGVADYTRSVALKLTAAGDAVHIFAPMDSAGPSADPAINVHLFPGHFGLASLRQMSRELRNISEPCTILVQYVPHAFGFKAMNVPFCFWLFTRRRKNIWIMFHEVNVPMGTWSIKRNLLGAANQLMAWFATHAARRAFVAIPAWIDRLKPVAPKKLLIQWTPVPSNVVTTISTQLAAELRQKITGTRFTHTIGHFGTYGNTVNELLRKILPVLLDQQPQSVVVLVGRNSDRFAAQFIGEYPQAKDRIIATGDLSAADVATHLAACDVIIQPYPDGASTRRGSLMASIALGRPVVTNEGFLSEPIWRESGAVALASIDDAESFATTVAELLKDPKGSKALGDRGQQLYTQKFTLECTIDALRRADAPDGTA